MDNNGKKLAMPSASLAFPASPKPLAKKTQAFSKAIGLRESATLSASPPDESKNETCQALNCLNNKNS